MTPFHSRFALSPGALSEISREIVMDMVLPHVSFSLSSPFVPFSLASITIPAALTVYLRLFPVSLRPIAPTVHPQPGAGLRGEV